MSKFAVIIFFIFDLDFKLSEDLDSISQCHGLFQPTKLIGLFFGSSPNPLYCRPWRVLTSRDGQYGRGAFQLKRIQALETPVATLNIQKGWGVSFVPWHCARCSPRSKAHLLLLTAPHLTSQHSGPYLPPQPLHRSESPGSIQKLFPGHFWWARASARKRRWTRNQVLGPCLQGVFTLVSKCFFLWLTYQSLSTGRSCHVMAQIRSRVQGSLEFRSRSA